MELLSVDDGRGSESSGRRSGVANLEARARLRGGTFDFESDAGGTLVRWSVPIQTGLAGS